MLVDKVKMRSLKDPKHMKGNLRKNKICVLNHFPEVYERQRTVVIFEHVGYTASFRRHIAWPPTARIQSMKDPTRQQTVLQLEKQG